MIKLPPPITINTYEENVGKWLRIINSGECGIILFFPKMDAHRRIPQLLKDTSLLNKYLKQPDKHLYLTLDFQVFMIEEAEDLEEFLANEINKIHEINFAQFTQWQNYFRENQIRLVLFIVNAEKLLVKDSQPSLYFLAKLAENNPQISVLLFFEKDIIHPDYFEFLSSRTIFFQNLCFYPLYKDPDIKQFIAYLSIKWNFVIPEDVVAEIIQKCGGHFWLVKEAVRYYRQTKDKTNIFNHFDMKLRIEGIFNNLTSNEKSVLKKITFKDKSFNETEKHSLDYLKKMNLITMDNKLTIQLISDHIKSVQENKTELVIENGNILFNKVPIDIFFAKKEQKVLRELLRKRNLIVSRDEIAKQLWPLNTEKYFSDWAIDQIIARIRKKLSKLYVSPTALVTLKGKGYKFTV